MRRFLKKFVIRVPINEHLSFKCFSRGVCHETTRKCKNNSLYQARKYDWIFVSGHYLFQDANSFPRAKIEETVVLEEQIMSNEKYLHIFSRK